jgi:hypothetical protein
MGAYETEPGIEPARIETMRGMRRRWKHGELREAPATPDDFFRDTARDTRRR